MSNATYDQLRFGQGLGVIELSRSGSGATLSNVLQTPGPVSFSQIAESRMRIDNEMLTAASVSRITGQTESTTLGTGLTQDGKEVAIVASSVRGLTLDQYNHRWDNLGLTPYDQMRMREDAAAKGVSQDAKAADGRTADGKTDQPRPGATEGDRVGEAFQTRFDDLRTDSATGADAKIDATAAADYARLLQNIADRYARAGNRDVAVDAGILKTLNDQYQGLKDELSGQPTGDSGPKQTVDPGTGQPLPTAPASDQAPTASPNPGRPDAAHPNDPRNRTAAPADQPKTDATEKPFDYSELAPALRHGERISSLTSKQQGRFNELMMAAEEQLKNGDYMIAEQRFQRAMRFSPGNPLAMAGAANAQIGAGLYLPAGYTLRSLYTQHPEMIDATYGEGLLPSSDRVAAALEAINTRLESGTDNALYGLVLAYLGRQTSDHALMDKGLKLMSQESTDDPLPPLLRSVWLEGAAAPAPKPDPEK
jgi:hypothetical protein